MIFCTLCFKQFNKNQQAAQHLIFGHRVRMPYRALYWKGYLADSDEVSVWDTPFPPRGLSMFEDTARTYPQGGIDETKNINKA